MLAVGTLLFLGVITSAQANMIDNGDFANVGSVWVNNTGLGSDDWQTAGATGIPGWSNVPGYANEFWFDGTANSYNLTQSPGNGSAYAVDLTGQVNTKPYGGIEQTITTMPGATYRLTFDLGASSQWNGPGNRAAALTASATGSAVDASQLFTLVPTADNQWQSESLAFTADSSSTTIAFLADSAYTSAYTGLDNVSVTPVPAPMSLPLFTSGLAGLGLACLRKRT